VRIIDFLQGQPTQEVDRGWICLAVIKEFFEAYLAIQVDIHLIRYFFGPVKGLLQAL